MRYRNIIVYIASISLLTVVMYIKFVFTFKCSSLLLLLSTKVATQSNYSQFIEGDCLGECCNFPFLRSYKPSFLKLHSALGETIEYKRGVRRGLEKHMLDDE